MEKFFFSSKERETRSIIAKTRHSLKWPCMYVYENKRPCTYMCIDEKKAAIPAHKKQVTYRVHFIIPYHIPE